MNKYQLIAISILIYLSGSIWAQQNEGKLALYPADQKLEKAIYKATKKHALFSYNIANITTPGFEPVLYPEDQEELNQIIPNNSELRKKVLLEHMSASMAKNRNLQASYLTLYKKRFDTYRQIATMGKR
ncbi:hypothetical protein CL647_02535 [bacterium]|nr:hypothetical protein [Actinomycetota bacterium]MBE32987.1 hypothetical protein [bacterium]|tara:strand:- start:3034 stop:3420 length:387 start_codon:yes stop_codon:yes gene_type:complete